MRAQLFRPLRIEVAHWSGEPSPYMSHLRRSKASIADQKDFEETSPCRESGFIACAAATGPPRVFSAVAAHRHELVHAYLAPLGLPAAVYAEGIAAVAMRSVDGIATKCLCDEGRHVSANSTVTNVRTCGAAGDREKAAVFTIESPSTVFVEATASLPYASSSPRRCDDAPVMPESFDVAPTDGRAGLTVATLAPGRYFLASVDTLKVTTRPLDALARCDASSPYRLDGSRSYSNITIVAGQQPVFLPLEIPAPQRAFGAPHGDLAICRGCDMGATSSCRLDEGGSLPRSRETSS